MAKGAQGQVNTQVQKMEQRQIASAGQVLAAKLTELSVEELCARINAECEDNPWLDTSSPSDDRDVYEQEDEGGDDTGFDEDTDTYSPEPNEDNEWDDDDFPQPRQNETYGNNGQTDVSTQSFYDFLIQQMGEYDLTEKQEVIMEYLIGSLDKDGLLRMSVEQVVDELDIYRNLRTNEQEVEQVLGILQQFDPWGVGARNLCECLLIQVKRNKSLPMRSQLTKLLTVYSDEMLAGHWENIERRMQISHTEMTTMRNVIKRLNPRPGGSVGATSAENNHSIVPDFTVSIDEDGQLHFHLNEDNVPIVTLADDYSDDTALQLAGVTNEKRRQDIIAAQRFHKNRMDEGRIFIEALATRRHSMILTMGALLRLQKDFFLEGDENLLHPMKLEDVAKLTKLDISTVSRVCRSKTVQTPYGNFPLNWFFSSKVEKDGEVLSVRNILNALQEIVSNEDKRKPYSDDALTKLLQERGYSVARRTIAKYRTQLGIPDSRLRR